jgi:hypothetical protein
MAPDDSTAFLLARDQKLLFSEEHPKRTQMAEFFLVFYWIRASSKERSKSQNLFYFYFIFSFHTHDSYDIVLLLLVFSPFFTR